MPLGQNRDRTDTGVGRGVGDVFLKAPATTEADFDINRAHFN